MNHGSDNNAVCSPSTVGFLGSHCAGSRGQIVAAFAGEDAFGGGGNMHTHTRERGVSATHNACRFSRQAKPCHAKGASATSSGWRAVVVAYLWFILGNKVEKARGYGLSFLPVLQKLHGKAQSQACAAKPYKGFGCAPLARLFLHWGSFFKQLVKI